MQGPSEFTSLPGLLRPMWERVQGGAPPATQEGACVLREQCKSLVWAFCVNQGISASFTPLFSYCNLPSSSLSVSINLFLVADVVPLRMTWIQQGLDPGTLHTWSLYQNFCKIWILLFFFRAVFSESMKSCSSWLSPSYYERPEEENIIHHFGAMHFSQSVARILELQHKGFLSTTSVSTYVC